MSMKYTITGDDFTITDAIRAHVERKFDTLEKFFDEKVPHEIFVTLGKSTAHSRENTFYAEAKTKLHSRDFFARSEAGDELVAIDMVKEELQSEITRSNAKRRTLFHRGARKIKELMKRIRE